LSKELLGSLEINRIYQMDCLEGMKLLPDKSIDLTVTSPPYDNLRTYNGYTFKFEEIAKELYRVTKLGGVVVWIVADATINGSETGTSFRQALYFKDVCGFNLHDTMIYLKENPTPLEHNRYQPCFEYMFVFSKGKPKTFNVIKVDAKLNSHGKKSAQRMPNGEIKTFSTERGRNTKKYKTNVWSYSVGFNQATKDKIAFQHPAIFPEKLAEDHILSWSNEGDIVLDPFMGSGTTAKMAQINKRKYIGFEISPEYIQIANLRLESINEDYPIK